jgi:hypothetical protein
VHNKQVSFNYRLGLFGHYTHPDLSSEDAAAGGAGVCGNYSLLDQVSSGTSMPYELYYCLYCWRIYCNGRIPHRQLLL